MSLPGWKEGDVINSGFVVPHTSYTSHPELKRQGEIMAKELAKGLEVILGLDDALKTE